MSATAAYVWCRTDLSRTILVYKSMWSEFSDLFSKDILNAY
ncbi:MAG: hypothetical protein OEQ18_07420 [Gammaproteobacteria bacterium]|nr:hypothetical protein [Gammaproteobacteria bacterium]